MESRHPRRLQLNLRALFLFTFLIALNAAAAYYSGVILLLWSILLTSLILAVTGHHLAAVIVFGVYLYSLTLPFAVWRL